MELEHLWGLMTIVGPILLIAAVAWAMLRNKTTAAQDRRTEQATAAQYDRASAEDKLRE